MYKKAIAMHRKKPRKSLRLNRVRREDEKTEVGDHRLNSYCSFSSKNLKGPERSGSPLRYDKQRSEIRRGERGIRKEERAEVEKVRRKKKNQKRGKRK